jgi:predicted nucleic acid-binding protein
VPADPKDGPILRTAIEAGADFLVTDDRHLLRLDPYEGIKIVSMRDYEAVLVAAGFPA